MIKYPKEKKQKKELENDPNIPLIYKSYESAVAAYEFLIDYYTSLKLYIWYGCVPEDSAASPLMMIKIENIFYLIKIHLTNNRSAPNFSRDCEKLNQAQTLCSPPSWEQRPCQAAHERAHPAPPSL